MQNWDSTAIANNNMQSVVSAANGSSNSFMEHNTWYNQMFAANIKTEPGTTPNPSAANVQTQSQLSPSATHLESYLKQQQQQQHNIQFADSATMTPSPSNNGEFFENSSLQQQMMHQQQQQQQQQQQTYQQHFQQAQQAAAQNQVSSHLPLGFNPLTPPGLPQAVLPAMSHFYAQQQRQHQQTPSPQPLGSALTDMSEKSALTPRHTPPMDITPPKSPKAMLLDHHHSQQHNGQQQQQQEDQDLLSNSSEDLKYIIESEDDEAIRLPIYNSHGKMKNHKCKSCGMVAITKLAFWEHARIHMKPEKILQCPKCPFVTELKHHLEYHIRKHKNLKPFQCDKCSYSCVNKSMLNSHRKSHSSVYQYRCADCDYATKYCHSFKLHLRKYEHKPGMVLDEEGIPNPSVVIDVYGTRRGPKNKGGSSGSGGNLKKACSDLKIPPTSQLSAALQGFPMQQQNQMPSSPAKSNSSGVSELPALTLNMSLQQQQQQHQQQQHQQQQQQQHQQSLTNGGQMSPQNSTTNGQQNQQQQQQQQINNLLPPLASLLQQNHNMAFFPYWNLNLQMLAAQQQAAVLAQLSPRMREQLQQKQSETNGDFEEMNEDDEDEEDEEENAEDDQEFDRKSVDSAMDLSQGTPTKEEQQQQTPELAINLKLAEEHNETPLFSSSAAVRRKGRVLKLDQDQLKQQQQQQNNNNNNSSVPSSPQHIQHGNEMPPTTSSPIGQTKLDDHSTASAADESMETGHSHNGTAVAPTHPINTSNTSTASSSGNSSNSSNTSASTSAASSPNNNNSSHNNNNTNNNNNNTNTNTGNGSGNNNNGNSNPTMYECKYCDIYFKDAVLYTIHMGYHSCDDVFKCNMCGEKCDGPVGLFVHMARNAHS